MEAIETLLLILLVADAIGLTVLVLMQQGKGAEVGAAFGSGSANTIFGSAGAGSFLTRLTVWLAIGFFVITFGLAYTAKQRAGNVTIEGLPELPADSAPVILDGGAAAVSGDTNEGAIEGAIEGEVPSGGQGEGSTGANSDSGLTGESERVDSPVPEV